MKSLISRKEFILGTGAFLGAGAMAAVAGRPLVRFGVVTDVHYADRAQTGNVDYRDTDVLTKDEFFAHVSNTGFAAAQGYYSFVRGGVKFIVLDANFNSDSDTGHYSRGNWTWSVAYIPPAERAWLEAELAAATGPVVVFCHQRLDGTGSYFVKNAAEVRRIIEKSCKVIGVFAGHEHAGGRNCMNGVSYYTLRSLAESGQSFEVACYPNGISVFGHGTNGG